MAGELYYSVFTEQGLALLRQAIQNGTKLGITDMSFGDGGGSLPVPNSSFTHLVNEVYKTQLNSLAPDPNNGNWLRAEAIIASAIGGFNIRELGLWAGNVLVAYSNYPPTYKPNPSDGTARIMTFRMVIQIDNTANFELVIDPDIVLATIQSVNIAKEEVLESTVPIKKDFPKILAERSIRFNLIHENGALRYGLNDPVPLDDNIKHHFRGLQNQDAWHLDNIGTGSVSFGRNGCSKAYLTATFGHDCITYGTASVAGGAGACTGNPDEPTKDADFGYCAFAWGKDTKAQGRISNAMGQECESNSRYSSTDGYRCIAGPQKIIYQGDVESEGAAARAHGYDSQAFGNWSFAYGTLLRASNGAQLIGLGNYATGTPLSLRKPGLGLGYGVDNPTIYLAKGNGVNGDGASIGFNTDSPTNRYDFRFRKSDVMAFNIDSTDPDAQMALVVRGLKDTVTQERLELFKIGVIHPSKDAAAAVTTFWQNGTQCARIDSAGNINFSSLVGAGGAGFAVNGTRVVGGQLPAIADLASTATLADTINKVNSILNAMRLHGLIAS